MQVKIFFTVLWKILVFIRDKIGIDFSILIYFSIAYFGNLARQFLFFISSIWNFWLYNTGFLSLEKKMILYLYVTGSYFFLAGASSRGSMITISCDKGNTCSNGQGLTSSVQTPSCFLVMPKKHIFKDDSIMTFTLLICQKLCIKILEMSSSYDKR